MFLTSQIFLFYCFCVVFQTMEILLFFCSILILLPALSLQYELLPFEEAWEDWTPKEYRGCLWAVGLMCLLFQSLSLSLSFCLQFFFFFFTVTNRTLFLNANVGRVILREISHLSNSVDSLLHL